MIFPMTNRVLVRVLKQEQVGGYTLNPAFMRVVELPELLVKQLETKGVVERIAPQKMTNAIENIPNTGRMIFKV